MSDVRTLNLSDADDGMVPLNDKPSTTFVPEKNVSEHKDTMDSTPIADVMGQPQEMLEPPMMAMDPRMMQQAAPPPIQNVNKEAPPATKKANPMNLTDDQMLALIVAACTAAAISKPVQEKLASTVPKFLNAQGNRSLVGLASTGLVAAVIFYFAKRYV
jgi:ADP-ribosylglycohydrolase